MFLSSLLIYVYVFVCIFENFASSKTRTRACWCSSIHIYYNITILLYEIAIVAPTWIHSSIVHFAHKQKCIWKIWQHAVWHHIWKYNSISLIVYFNSWIWIAFALAWWCNMILLNMPNIFWMWQENKRGRGSDIVLTHCWNTSCHYTATMRLATNVLAKLTEVENLCVWHLAQISLDAK